MKRVRKPGTKYDSGKLRYDLIPISAEVALAEVLTYGAKKYAERDWEKGIAYSRVYAAARRHLAKWWEGVDLDSESKLAHLHHALCNIAFLIEFSKTHKDLDDRPARPKQAH